MNNIFENAFKRVEENNLADLLLHKKYSDDENLQKAFLDGYSVGMLSSLMITPSQNENPDEVFDINTELLQKAINGDKEAISELEYLTNNKK